MRELDGLRIIEPDDGDIDRTPARVLREIVPASDTGGRWSFGEITAAPGADVSTHIHPGEPEAIMILEGNVEVHGSNGVTHLREGDVLFIPPDTEHGLRVPQGGRWIAVWPTQQRIPGPRYTS